MHTVTSNIARPELQFFESNLDRLLKHHSGEYVLIDGERIVAYFDTYEAALREGYAQFGLNSFFVKQITEESATVHYTRDPGPCRL